MRRDRDLRVVEARCPQSLDGFLGGAALAELPLDALGLGDLEVFSLDSHAGGPCKPLARCHAGDSAVAATRLVAGGKRRPHRLKVGPPRALEGATER